MRLLTLSAVFLTIAIAPAFAADVSGTWNAQVEFENGAQGTPSFTLKQAGGKLTGSFTNPTFSNQPLTGTVTGDSFSFDVNAEVQGVAVKISYKGKFEGGKLVGTVARTVNGETVAGKFTATKQ
jgi:opacity protein-like surface antigen